MADSTTSTGRPALTCDDESGCRRRFWSPSRDRHSYPAGASGDLRVRARRQGWRCGGGRDLCPHHAEEPHPHG